jgi:hypothetical protein
VKNQRKISSDQESPEVPSVALPSSPSSPQEEKFWTTPLGPSRTLHFTDNLMDELVDLGDISTTSFQSPLPMQPTSKLGQLGTLGDTALFDAPFMSDLTPEKEKDRENDNDNEEEEDGCKDLNSTLGVDDLPVTPTVALHLDTKDMIKKPNNQIAETPSRQRRVRVNIEVERIIVSMKCILSDIGLPSFA